MDANTQRPTANILNFPARGRVTASNSSAKAKFEAEVRALRKLKLASETAWYHEEAIDDAAPNRKN